MLKNPGTAAAQKTVRMGKRVSIHSATSGPTMAPAESMACMRPKAAPIFLLSTDSASITSRGAVRIPLETRSLKRMMRTCHHDVATARMGLAKFATT